MIKIEKDFEDIPSILKKENRKEAFAANILACKDIDTKNLYKTNSVRDKLAKTYHNKCAYCEKDISDEPKHIEHYRPKDSYYWLNYSWDNLLFCCTRCNSKKNKNFKTKNQKATYANEKFEDIHSLSDDYDKKEKPYIINPEKDDILDDIKFYSDAEMYSENERVQYTIDEACKLNRPELVQHRVQIVNDFKNLLIEQYSLCSNTGDLRFVRQTIKNFIIKCKKENEYFALRQFVIKNFTIFLNIKKEK